MSGAASSDMKVTLKVWRQAGPDDPGGFESYKLVVSPDMSFLEMLDVLNEELILDGREPVAFDHDCREGICGMCSLVINGQPHGPHRQTTTCQLHMRSFSDGDSITIEPFRANAFPVLRDLVVDRTAFDRIMCAGGYVSVNTGSAPDANALPVPKQDADLAMDAAACIGCGACVASCKNAAAMLFVSAKVSQLALLPQGAPERRSRVRAMVERMDAEGFGNCTNEEECEAACPKAISVANIARLNREYLRAALTARGLSRADTTCTGTRARVACSRQPFELRAGRTARDAQLPHRHVAPARERGRGIADGDDRAPQSSQLRRGLRAPHRIGVDEQHRVLAVRPVERHGDPRPLSRRGRDADLAVQSLHAAEQRRPAEARASGRALASAEEPLDFVRRHAAPVVLDGDLDPPVPHRLAAQAHCAIRVRRLDGVGDEVAHEPTELLGIGVHAQAGGATHAQPGAGAVAARDRRGAARLFEQHRAQDQAAGPRGRLFVEQRLRAQLARAREHAPQLLDLGRAGRGALAQEAGESELVAQVVRGGCRAPPGAQLALVGGALFPLAQGPVDPLHEPSPSHEHLLVHPRLRHEPEDATGPRVARRVTRVDGEQRRSSVARPHDPRAPLGQGARDAGIERP